MRRLGLVVLVGLLAVTACGQVAGQAPAPVKPDAQAPTLTTEQRLGLENTLLKIRLAQQELQALGAELGRQVQAIEVAHPGWTFDLQTGQLARKPAAPTEPKK